MKMPVPTEHCEQRAIFDWIALAKNAHPELGLLFAVPNGARVAWKQARKLKAEGLSAGVPDLVLPIARRGFHGCWLELKRIGGRPTEAQLNWLAALKSEGHWAVVVYGAEQAIQELRWYLEI